MLFNNFNKFLGQQKELKILEENFERNKNLIIKDYERIKLDKESNLNYLRNILKNHQKELLKVKDEQMIDESINDTMMVESKIINKFLF